MHAEQREGKNIKNCLKSHILDFVYSYIESMNTTLALTYYIQLMNSKSKAQSVKSISFKKKESKQLLSPSPSLRLSKSQSKIDKNRNQIDLNNYRVILNKMLNLKKYDQLFQYSLRFIPKQILQCKVQRPESFSAIINNKIGEKLISDGIYIKHWIQIESELGEKSCLQIWKKIAFFRKSIKINRRIFKQYADRIREKCKENNMEQSSTLSQDLSETQINEPFFQKEDFIIQEHPSEHKNTKSSKITKNKQPKQGKTITFQQYVKSHRKQIEQSIKIVKKRMQETNSQRKRENQRISSMLGNMYSPIKRNSIRQSCKIYQPVEKMTDRNLATLPLYEQQFIKKYLPTIDSIGRLNSGVSIIGNIKKLGQYRNYEVMQIGIEYNDPKEPQDFGKVINFAVMLKQKECLKDNEKKSDIEDEGGSVKLTIDRDIYIFVTID